METAQIMMTPATTQAAPSSAGTPSLSSMGGADNAGFGSLLGQTIDLLQQDGMVLPLSGTAAAATTLAAQQDAPQAPTVISVPTAVLPQSQGDQKPEDATASAPHTDDGQDAAQQLAGLLQASLMVSAAAVTPTAVAASYAADQSAVQQTAAPVAAVATAAPAGAELSAAKLEQLLMATANQGPGEDVSAAQPAAPAAAQQISQHAADPVVAPAPTADAGSLKPMVVQQQAAAVGQQLAAAQCTAKPTPQTEAAKSAVPAGTAVAAEAGRTAVADVPAAPKGTASVVAAVRFACPTDVAVATVPPGQPQQDAPQFADGKAHGGVATQMEAATAADKAAEPGGFDKQLTMPDTMDLSGHGAAAVLQHHQATLQELQPVVEPAKAAAEQQVMRQLTDRLEAHEIKQGADQITLKLSPDHLGDLQVNLRMDNQQVRVEIVAEHRSVREALLQQVDQLKESLSRQNIKMESFDVTTANNGGLMQQQGGDWRQTASERRPLYAQQFAAGRSATAGLSADAAGTAVQYFAPQYQSTLDVRF